jgi:methyltransferase (TIGR00027 family)
MDLTNVSRTAITTLRSHALEAEKSRPLIRDPMARLLLTRLSSFASESERALLFDRKLSSTLTRFVAIRARKFDAIVDDFVREHPSCTVVNLGCGFDTRYWRIDHAGCEYIELDLPEVVALKREALKGEVPYELLGCSVLDPSWIEKLTRSGRRNFLLLAEGLFMYLPKRDVIALFREMAARFLDSRIAFEVVSDKYMRGLWKKVLVIKVKHELGFDAGSSMDFGVREAREIESYGAGLKVIDEWSFVEDPDTRPRIIKHLGFSKSQWVVTAAIHEGA